VKILVKTSDVQRMNCETCVKGLQFPFAYYDEMFLTSFYVSILYIDNVIINRRNATDPFRHGKYVKCRILRNMKKYCDVSLRRSKIESDKWEVDEVPKSGAIVQGYVIDTNKKGCFVRFSRRVEGHATLKELSDAFLPEPHVSFPPGRLVLAKIKDVKQVQTRKEDSHEFEVDLDMRESSILETSQNNLNFDDIEVGSSYKGTVTRLVDFGAFVQLRNSNLSGLVHTSECSDDPITKASDLYDPGDLVKVKVLKKNDEKKQLSFSMKASLFVDDDDSDDDDNSSSGDSSEGSLHDEDDSDLDSDDENFAAKLASRLTNDDEDDDVVSVDSKDKSESESDDDSDNGGSDDMEVDDGEKGSENAMETDVGFSWSVQPFESLNKEKKDNDTSEDESSEESEDEEEDDDGQVGSSHKSRKRQANRRRQEQEISRRETALADGTADDNPETVADFERLLSSQPNSSELWIRYMAFYLALADIAAARTVAERAFDRIEFREETEKLNVWCALLTLELKYGSEATFETAMSRACQHNNPKKVYLRVCEVLEKEAELSPSHDSLERVNDMYSRMCKRFRDKKTVWLAHLAYLLKHGRQDEAYNLSKRALQSLPRYKHLEVMSKFAQLLFDYHSPDTARTVFDGLLVKYPKRLDLLFVYIDKEVKHGNLEDARKLLERVVNPHDDTHKMKLSDKQMKSLFKKWYGIEEQHGTETTQEHVKDMARAYVERSSR
jgi:rRNA biogenesis protein RRP5